MALSGCSVLMVSDAVMSSTLVSSLLRADRSRMCLPSTYLVESLHKRAADKLSASVLPLAALAEVCLCLGLHHVCDINVHLARLNKLHKLLRTCTGDIG